MNIYSKAARRYLKESTRGEFETAIYNAKLTPFQEQVVRLHILNDKSVVAIAMEQHGEDGSSYDYEGGSYRRRRMSYDDGGSGRRYYDGEGGGSGRRYYDNDSYDMGHSGHDMRQKLERMMQEADSEREKQALREVLNKL